MDYERIKNKHINNMSRQLGHDISGKYHYIVNGNDFMNAYIQMRNDLGYPLMIDSKYRRAVVYNKKGLEKQINETLIKTIVDNIHLLDRMIMEDIANQINNIVQTPNGTVKLVNKSNNNSATKIFINAMVKGMVQGIGHIVEDMINPNDRRRY